MLRRRVCAGLSVLAQVANFLNEVPQECAAYTSAWTTLQKIFQQLGGKGASPKPMALCGLWLMADAVQALAKCHATSYRCGREMLRSGCAV